MGDWHARLAGREDAMAALTRDLVAIDTTNPPGRGYAECADLLERALAELDLPCERTEVSLPGLEPRYCLRSSWGEGERALYLHGHYDVVPAQDPSQFEPRLEDGSLYGRGSADMKSGLALLLHVVAALREAGTELDGRVVLQLVPDEEDGSRGGSAWLSEHGLLADDGAIGMLTPEPTGGVVWHESKGALTQRITVHGRESHVGLMHLGDNAFERMLDVAGALRGLGLLLGGEASSGAGFNVVPARASFTLDSRLDPEDEELRGDVAATIDAFRARGYEIEVESLQDAPAAASAEDGPLASALAASAGAIEGAAPAFERCPGVLETRWYALRGIPAYAYGPGLLEVSHGPQEHVELAAITRCAAVYAQTIERVLA